MNERGDLALMSERADEYEMLGEVCDDGEDGGNGRTECGFFRRGTCRTEVKRDVFGNLIHVKRY